MVFKFRRSMKIAPGIRINVTHRGAGVRVGPKGAGYFVNTSGKQTLSGGIPGSGIHVSETISSGRRKHYFISDIPPGSLGRGGFTLSSDAQVVAKIHSKSISPVRIRCTLKWDDVFGESQDIRFELLGFRYNEAEENERGHKGKLRIEWQWGNDPDGFVSSEEPEDTV